MSIDHFEPLHYDKPIPYDRWTCVEQHIKLNSPGKRNGIARAWMDGELVFEKADYLWRHTDQLKIHSYWIDNSVASVVSWNVEFLTQIRNRGEMSFGTRQPTRQRYCRHGRRAG